jgi:hypothetical protein
MAKKKVVKKKRATKAEGRGDLARIATEAVAEHGKEWTGTEFLAHVKEKFPDLKNPDGSIKQAWTIARKKAGLTKKRKGAKKVVAKKGTRRVKPVGDSVGNGMVSVVALQFIRQAGSLQAAKIQLESLEEVFGDKVPF